MHNILVVLIILFGLLVSNNCFKDLDFQQISSIVESSNVVNFNLRVKKTSRFSYGISGNIEILDDAIDKYMVTKNTNEHKSIKTLQFQIEIKIFHSSNGNNQFRLYPMGFRNLPIKRFMNRQYRDYLMETLQPPVSELPYSSNPFENLNQQVKKV